MNYPFTAIVGQEMLKKALLLCAINPAIGGLLIQGDKGTAKSTAARALAEVVPMVINESMELVQVPFINLPIGATEERVLGSLDLEAVLVEKKKKFQPGLLAAVHQGILYIDEVNLLPDHLVDVLLDVSAMGENIIEREGLSISHPSRFTLIGTMNPEEGQLRPQFLDRFGIMVHVDAPADIEERTEVVRRRIAFEKDPVSFIQQWEPEQLILKERVFAAKQLLPTVNLSDELLSLISQYSTALHVKSLRADIVMYKTALTLAALDHRTEVNAEDIREAAELALAHRSKKNTFSEPQSPAPAPPPPSSPQQGTKNQPPSPDKDNQGPEDTNPGAAQEEQDSPEGDQSEGNGRPEEEVFRVGNPIVLPKIEGYGSPSREKLPVGRGTTRAEVKRGAYVRSEPVKNATDIAIDATVVHALTRNPDELNITIKDLHQKKRSGKTSNLILFVVDASGSMAASKRMEAVKGTVMSLLTDAYQKRDTVGVISFRGIAAQVLLQPTQSIDLAEEAMKNLPTGGRTPLPHALQLALQILDQFDRKKGFQPVLIVLTDGKANVALEGGGDPWIQTITLANQLKQLNIKSLVLNTDLNYLNLGRGEELAASLGAAYRSLNEISATHLTPIINQILS